ncbi:hypothetical protein ACFPC0_04795 [Streptomyces andamanensis]|uniref:Uncharacterized protein n=1 Tax=Streptomyces andamanensis TaxID=1565035 RepID=A0ABV8T990_9ACTN
MQSAPTASPAPGARPAQGAATAVGGAVGGAAPDSPPPPPASARFPDAPPRVGRADAVRGGGADPSAGGGAGARAASPRAPHLSAGATTGTRGEDGHPRPSYAPHHPARPTAPSTAVPPPVPRRAVPVPGGAPAQPADRSAPDTGTVPPHGTRRAAGGPAGSDTGPDQGPLPAAGPPPGADAAPRTPPVPGAPFMPTTPGHGVPPAPAARPSRPADRPGPPRPAVPPARYPGRPGPRPAHDDFPGTGTGTGTGTGITNGTGEAPAAPGPALPWTTSGASGTSAAPGTRTAPGRRTASAAPTAPGAYPGPARPYVLFGEPEGYDARGRGRALGVRIRPRAALAAACVVLGLGLIGGALTGSWLTGDSGDGGGAGTFAAAGTLWHSIPVDRLFPPTVDGRGAGPGGADRTWTRIAVAPDSGCADAFDPLLRKALSPVGCTRLLRATYTDATQSFVTTVGLLFTKADAPAMRSLAVRFRDEGLDRRTDLLPRPYAAPGTVAAAFGDRQRASWTVSVLTEAPVVVYAVSGWADGRAADAPQPAADAMKAGAATPAAQAGLGHEAKGLADRIERGFRTTAGQATEKPS